MASNTSFFNSHALADVDLASGIIYGPSDDGSMLMPPIDMLASLTPFIGASYDTWMQQFAGHQYMQVAPVTYAVGSKTVISLGKSYTFNELQ